MVTSYGFVKASSQMFITQTTGQAQHTQAMGQGQQMGQAQQSVSQMMFLCRLIFIDHISPSPKSRDSI